MEILFIISRPLMKYPSTFNEMFLRWKMAFYIVLAGHFKSSVKGEIQITLQECEVHKLLASRLPDLMTSLLKNDVDPT